MDAKVTVEGCRCCKDRREPHTYEHDLIAMRNIIHGAIFRSEALAAMERLQEAFTERDAQIAEMRKATERWRVVDAIPHGSGADRMYFKMEHPHLFEWWDAQPEPSWEAIAAAELGLEANDENQ